MIKTTFSLLGFLIAGLMFFFFTQDAYDNAKALESQINEYDQALEKASELQQIKQSLLSRYNAFDPADIDRLHKLLPDHVDNVRLVLDLDSLAARNGLALQNVVISNPVSGKQPGVISAIGGSARKFDSLTLKFSTQGTYEGFSTFLEELETSLRVVDLVSLNLEREVTPLSSQKGAEPIYRYDITIRTYWLK